MTGYKQDMPPASGYPPIDALRKPLKRPLNGLMLIAGLYAVSACGFAYQRVVREKRDTIVRENNEIRIALTPFLLAEQQRLYLKHLNRNRDFEASLMADIPGWKVGNWHDYPVYHNPRDMWCDPNSDEFYAHTTIDYRNSHVSTLRKYA